MTEATTGTNHLRIKRCRDGMMLFPIRDQYIGQSLDRYGEFSRGESLVFEQIVRPGDTVLDLGANLGAHTVHISRMVGVNGRVLAFEPQLPIFQIMCANLAINGLTNVEAYWAAISSRSGSITVPRLDLSMTNNFGALRLGSANQGDIVRTIAVDDLDLSSCRFIKADIEGMEYEAILGARETILRLKPVMYLEYIGGELCSDLYKLIEGLGYDMWWHLPLYFSPENYNSSTYNPFGGEFSANILCIHRDQKVQISHAEKVNGPDDHYSRPAKLGEKHLSLKFG